MSFDLRACALSENEQSAKRRSRRSQSDALKGNVDGRMHKCATPVFTVQSARVGSPQKSVWRESGGYRISCFIIGKYAR